MPVQAPRVSLVIPARNEARRLPPSIRRIREAFPGEAWEFLVVVEKSSDDTAGRAREAAGGDARFEILENPEARGKGFAVKTGMLRARGDWVFFMDADLSVPLECVTNFLEIAGKADGDILLGSRRHPESVIERHQPAARERSGRFFNLVLRLAGVTRFTDTQCGFKAFRRDAAQAVFSKVEQDGFGFDVEIVVLADLLGLRVIECPVRWADVEGSKVRWMDGAKALVEAVLAARRLRGKYSRHALSRSQH